VFISDFGDIQVNDVCVAYCEACDDISENEDNIKYADCGVCHEQASSPGMSSLVVVATSLLILTFMRTLVANNASPTLHQICITLHCFT